VHLSIMAGGGDFVWFSLRMAFVTFASPRVIVPHNKQTRSCCWKSSIPKYILKSCQPKPSKESNQSSSGESAGWFQKLLSRLGYDKATRMSAGQVVKKYGVAAILSYGLFDAVTYSLSFIIALIGYIRTTGKPLTWKTFPLVFGLMWGINNFSRPFRVAGALLLAPWMDKYIVQRWKRSHQPPPQERKKSQ
jgi:hypothetical protein